MITTGEIFEAFTYMSANPTVLIYCVISSVMGYLSVAMVLLLIKHFGATIAEVVKSCRKVVSICLSFLLYAKPISSNHVIGGLLFAMSISIGTALTALALANLRILLIGSSHCAAQMGCHNWARVRNAPGPSCDDPSVEQCSHLPQACM